MPIIVQPPDTGEHGKWRSAGENKFEGIVTCSQLEGAQLVWDDMLRIKPFHKQ